MLHLVHERESSDRYYRIALREVENGFARDTAERLHGSLLTIRQLLDNPGPWMTSSSSSSSSNAGSSAAVMTTANESSSTSSGRPPPRPPVNSSTSSSSAAVAAVVAAGSGDGFYVEDKLRSFCALVLAHREHRDPCVRRAVMGALPPLSRFAGPEFADFLQPAALHLIAATRHSEHADRPLAFRALARLGMAVGRRLWSVPAVWKGVVQATRDGLMRRPGLRRAHKLSEGALACLEMVVTVTTAVRGNPDAVQVC
jgi:hypothetical protein